MGFWKNYYILVILLTIATVLSFAWLFLNRKKINAKWWEVLIISLAHTIVGVGFVKFFALLEAGFDVNKAGNLSMYGGIFFMPIFYFIYAKIKKLPLGLVFDIFTISLVSTLLLARINCLFSGCCLGKNINYTEARYPTRELEIGYDVIFLAISIFFIYKNKFPGKIYLIYLISYGVFRFIIEWMRESNSTSAFHIAHVWSLLAVLIGVGLLVYIYFKNKDKEKQ